jgi:hypothetical protein
MTAHYDHALANARHAERYRPARPGRETTDGRLRRAANPAVTSVRRGLGLLLLEAGLHLIATADRRGAARSRGLYSVDHQASNSV